MLRDIRANKDPRSHSRTSAPTSGAGSTSHALPERRCSLSSRPSTTGTGQASVSALYPCSPGLIHPSYRRLLCRGHRDRSISRCCLCSSVRHHWSSTCLHNLATWCTRLLLRWTWYLRPNLTTKPATKPQVHTRARVHEPVPSNDPQVGGAHLSHPPIRLTVLQPLHSVTGLEVAGQRGLHSATGA